VDFPPPRLFDMSDDPSIIQNGSTTARIVTLVGDNVRRLRERAGLSLRELATRAEVSTSTLSNLESGTGNPGVETLVHISGALGVPFSELIVPHEPDVLVQRADQGVVVRAAGADFTSRLLLAATGRSVTEVYEAKLEPGDVYRAEPHLPGVTESVIVIRGRMRVGPAHATVELASGDRASFAADQPHSYQALTSGTRAILVLSYR
jgi:transcriptional regulator with XRE-family HTH domain